MRLTPSRTPGLADDTELILITRPVAGVRGQVALVLGHRSASDGGRSTLDRLRKKLKQAMRDAREAASAGAHVEQDDPPGAPGLFPARASGQAMSTPAIPLRTASP